jgi:hypothetical protein
VCDEDSDTESVSADDSDDLDEESPSDSESGSDQSYVPGSSDSDSSAMEVDPPVLPADEEKLGALTARNAGAWCEKWLSTASSQTEVMTRWRDDLRQYHLCSDEPEVSYTFSPILMYSNYIFKLAKANLDVRQEAAVTALREMKVVTTTYYNNNSWRRKVKVWV